MFLKILYYLTIIIWIFPAIRQFRSWLFGMFLTLAFVDPLGLILKFYGFPEYTFVATEFLVLVMIFILLKKPLLSLQFVLFIIGIIILNGFINYPVLDNSILIGELLFLLLILLKIFAENNIAKKSLNLFYIILLFYFLTVILKILIVIIGTPHAQEYFIITSIFQLAFGLFFSIFREDDSRLHIKLE